MRKASITTCALDPCLSWKKLVWKIYNMTYCIIYLKDRSKTSFAIFFAL